jgi:hypothetical protein
MLRRISTVAAGAAMLGLIALPATANAQAHHPSHGSFKVPSANSSISATGTYKFTTFRKKHVVEVQLCAKLSGSAFFVIAEANAYGSNGKVDGQIAATVGQETPGHHACGTGYLPGLSHLKVYTKVYSSTGKIIAQTSMKSIY